VRLLVAIVGTLALLTATSPRAACEEIKLAVIVHPLRAAPLTRDVVKRIYLKRQRFWSDGHPIVAINQEVATSARALFTRLIFGEDAERLSTYWNEQYFHGILPPIILGSEEAVVRYVASRPDAIGYVDVHHVDATVATALLLP